MKRFLTIVLIVLAVFCGLPGCGSSGSADADLVFVNDSKAVITAVAADSADRTSAVRNAGSCPLERGETFGFAAGAYPVTIVAYGDAELRRELGRVTVRRAPPEGGRWYVTAREGGDGLLFTVGTEKPWGV